MNCLPSRTLWSSSESRAQIATDTITSLQSMKCDQPTKDKPILNRVKPAQYSREGRTLVTIKEHPKRNPINRNENCILCQSSHDLDACANFKAKTLSEGKQLARGEGTMLCMPTLWTYFSQMQTKKKVRHLLQVAPYILAWGHKIKGKRKG